MTQQLVSLKWRLPIHVDHTFRRRANMEVAADKFMYFTQPG